MRVRYLSGNLAGQVDDLPQPEAENAVATGFAEAAPEDAPAPASFEPDTAIDEPEAPKPARRKK